MDKEDFNKALNFALLIIVGGGILIYFLLSYFGVIDTIKKHQIDNKTYSNIEFVLKEQPNDTIRLNNALYDNGEFITKDNAIIGNEKQGYYYSNNFLYLKKTK